MKKRIFILFLCLVLVTSTFMVSASAAETSSTSTVTDLTDTTWQLKDPSELVGASEKNYHINFKVSGYEEDLTIFRVLPGKSSNYYNVCGFFTADASTSLFRAYTTESSWLYYGNGSQVEIDPPIIIISGGDDVTNADLIAWLADNATPMGPPAVIPATLEEVQMSEVMNQILMILPIALVCLVGWIGLRKGLQVLVRLLRKA